LMLPCNSTTSSKAGMVVGMAQAAPCGIGVSVTTE